MKRLALEIHAACRDGRLPLVFGPKEFAQAVPGWAKNTYTAFLPKHRLGNPGGNTELFERVAPGRYKLLAKGKGSFLYPVELQDEQDGRWSSWIEDLPGCAAWGYSREEALSGIEDAAAAYVEDMIAAGEQPPKGKHAASNRPTIAVHV